MTYPWLECDAYGWIQYVYLGTWTGFADRIMPVELFRVYVSLSCRLTFLTIKSKAHYFGVLTCLSFWKAPIFFSNYSNLNETSHIRNWNFQGQKRKKVFIYRCIVKWVPIGILTWIFQDLPIFYASPCGVQMKKVYKSTFQCLCMHLTHTIQLWPSHILHSCWYQTMSCNFFRPPGGTIK